METPFYARSDMVCAAEDELDVGGELMLWVYGLVIACSDVWRHLVQNYMEPSPSS